ELVREELLLDADAALSAQGRLFERIIPVTVGGREWTLCVTTTPKFEAGVSRAVPMLIGRGGAVITLLLAGLGFSRRRSRGRPLLIGLGGAVLTLLLAGVVFSLGMSRGRALALAREMTASLRATEAEARRLAMVADHTDNAVVITDTGGYIEWINTGFTRITGFELDEVRGKKPGSFLQGPKTDLATVEVMRQGIASRKGFDVEIINYTKTGEDYWLHIEVRPLHDAAGVFTGFMAIESDISERKAAEQKLLANE